MANLGISPAEFQDAVDALPQSAQLLKLLKTLDEFIDSIDFSGNGISETADLVFACLETTLIPLVPSGQFTTPASSSVKYPTKELESSIKSALIAFLAPSRAPRTRNSARKFAVDLVHTPGFQTVWSELVPMLVTDCISTDRSGTAAMEGSESIADLILALSAHGALDSQIPELCFLYGQLRDESVVHAVLSALRDVRSEKWNENPDATLGVLLEGLLRDLELLFGLSVSNRTNQVAPRIESSEQVPSLDYSTDDVDLLLPSLERKESIRDALLAKCSQSILVNGQMHHALLDLVGRVAKRISWTPPKPLLAGLKRVLERAVQSMPDEEILRIARGQLDALGVSGSKIAS